MAWVSPERPIIDYWISAHYYWNGYTIVPTTFSVGGLPAGKVPKIITFFLPDFNSVTGDELNNLYHEYPIVYFMYGGPWTYTGNGIYTGTALGYILISLLKSENLDTIPDPFPTNTPEERDIAYATTRIQLECTDGSIITDVNNLPPVGGPIIGSVYPKYITPGTTMGTITGTGFGTVPVLVPGSPAPGEPGGGPGTLGSPGSVSIRNVDTNEITGIGVTTWTDGQITFDMPAGLAPGTYEVTVVNPWGQSITYTITIGDGSLIYFDIIAVRSI